MRFFSQQTGNSVKNTPGKNHPDVICPGKLYPVLLPLSRLLAHSSFLNFLCNSYLISLASPVSTYPSYFHLFAISHSYFLSYALSLSLSILPLSLYVLYPAFPLYLIACDNDKKIPHLSKSVVNIYKLAVSVNIYNLSQ